MKKKFWMLGVAVAALTSCTTNEVVDIAESRVIKFDTFVEKGTRAVNEMNSSSLTQFYVFGYFTPYTKEGNVYYYDFATSSTPVFENTQVTPITNEDGSVSWIPATDGYWSMGQMYHFAAYSNYNASLNFQDSESSTSVSEPIVSYNPNEDKITFEGYTVVDNAAQPDLIAAISSDRPYESGATPVQFVFRHMLAKVTLTLVNTSSNATLDYTNLSISNVCKKGTCTYLFNDEHTVYWSDWNLSGPFSYGAATIAPKGDSGVNTFKTIDFYMIPQTLSEDTELTFELSEKVGDDEVISKSYSATLYGAKPGDKQGGGTPPVIDEWKAGYHYNYLIVNGQEFQKITFSVTSVEDWIVDVNGDSYKDNNDYITLTPVVQNGQEENDEN